MLKHVDDDRYPVCWETDILDGWFKTYTMKNMRYLNIYFKNLYPRDIYINFLTEVGIPC